MKATFSDMLIEGTRNSLGRVNEVIDAVLHDSSRLEELYRCLFHDDEWARMRAADALEKICREHPEWIEAYIDRMQDELSEKTQPSIQWHLAQIYMQVHLSDVQRAKAIHWLEQLVATTDVDWIVAVNVMKALVYFEKSGAIERSEMLALVTVQLGHRSKSVVRKARKFLDEYDEG